MKKLILIAMILLATPALADDQTDTSWWDNVKKTVYEYFDSGSYVSLYDWCSPSRISTWR